MADYDFDDYKPKLEKLNKRQLICIIEDLIYENTEISYGSWTQDEIEGFFNSLISTAKEIK